MKLTLSRVKLQSGWIGSKLTSLFMTDLCLVDFLNTFCLMYCCTPILVFEIYFVKWPFYGAHYTESNLISLQYCVLKDNSSVTTFTTIKLQICSRAEAKIGGINWQGCFEEEGTHMTRQTSNSGKHHSQIQVMWSTPEVLSDRKNQFASFCFHPTF